MQREDNEDKPLRSVTLQNPQAILRARERGEKALELKIQELSQEREWFQVALSSIGDAVITTDPSGKVIFLNPVAEKLTGWKLNEAIGQPLERVFRIINEDTREPGLNPVEQALREGKIVALADQTALIGKDGAETSIEDSAAPIKDCTGKISEAVLVFHDVTEGRRAQEALRRTEQLLTDFYENASVGLHWVGPDGRILGANRTELELLGYTQEEYVGQHISEFHADEESIKEILAQLDSGRTLLHREAKLRCKDGVIKFVLLSSNVLRENGKLIHTRCFTRDITALKKVELALRESENRKSAILSVALDAIITMDHEGRVVDFNPAAESIFGYRGEQVIGAPLAELIIPERLRPAHRRGLARYLASGEGPVLGKRLELPGRHADGHEFPTELSINRISGVEPAMFTATLRDITERRRVEEALRESEERFRATFKQAAVGIAVATLDGHFLELNRKFEEILGYSSEELQRKTYADLTHPDELAQTQDRLSVLLAGEIQEAVFEKRYARKVGAVVWNLTTITALKDASGVPRRLIGVIEDITERKRADEFRLRLAAVVESSDDAIITETLEGLISTWNQGAERMFGYSAAEVIGKPILILIPPDRMEEEPIILEKIKRGERIEHFETVRRRKDGTLLDVALTVSPIKDREGRIIGVSKIGRDISERKRSEKALLEAQEGLNRHAEDLEKQVGERTADLRETIGELEAFSYSISHDMRAPVRAMQSFAHLLAEECAEQVSPEGKEYIRRITSAAQRMDRLIQDVLTYSRTARQDLALTPVDTGKLLRDILESYPMFHAPAADVQLEGDFPSVLAAEAILTQCISNVLGNAVNFVPPGVTARGRVWAEPLPDGERVRLFFKDNGLGVEQDMHEMIFKIFQRASKNYEGTGIGLAVVKKGVERMGGTVGLESQLGQGSTFWLELKRARFNTE